MSIFDFGGEKKIFNKAVSIIKGNVFRVNTTWVGRR